MEILLFPIENYQPRYLQVSNSSVRGARYAKAWIGGLPALRIVRRVTEAARRPTLTGRNRRDSSVPKGGPSWPGIPSRKPPSIEGCNLRSERTLSGHTQKISFACCHNGILPMIRLKALYFPKYLDLQIGRGKEVHTRADCREG